MRLLPILALCALPLAACQTEPVPEADATAPDATEVVQAGYLDLGTMPESPEVMTVEEIAETPESYADEMIAVQGTVREVCQMQGCWLTLRSEDGDQIRVTVPKDDDGAYLWTFPKDLRQDATLVGMFSFEETDVETLRHFAEERGATEAELAAIDAPKREMRLSAQGARVQLAATPADGA